MTSTPNRYFLYQIYRSGTFLGLLQGVTTPFQYGQDINSAGAALNIEVSDTPDHVHDAPEPILTEEGIPITTESGETLYTEGAAPNVGNYSRALIRNNNDVRVYEVSSTYPSGKLVFSGFISRWRGRFGGEDKILINCISDGQDLDNYIVQGSQTLDQSQALQGTTYFSIQETSGKFNSWNRVGQTFTVGAGTNLAAILISMEGAVVAVDVTIKLYNTVSDANAGVTPLASVTKSVTGVGSTPKDELFTFPSVVPVSVGQQYFFTVTTIDGGAIPIDYKNSDVYAGGGMYEANYGGGSGGGNYTLTPNGNVVTNSDLYFKTYYTAGATSAPFNSQDPVTMLRTIIDAYVASGGAINYASGTTVLTGLTKSYTFKVNTVLEAIKKILDLSPYNFYWYVDPATDVLYFKSAGTTADHTMILGRHLESLDLEASIEEVKNDVYFTGGDVGGNVNLFVHQSGTSAVLAANAGRKGLVRNTDNRVTLSDTAQTLANNFLNANSSEKYHTQITVNATAYDITLFALGQIVGFGGFGNFIDSLLLQIVRIDRREDNVTLTLGAIPQRASSQVEELERRLNEVETLYNPSVPS